jgi:hypothetical protein
MRTLITSALLAAAAFGLSLASSGPASAQTSTMTLQCLVNECTIADAPAGTAAVWWSLNGPGGPVRGCSDTDTTCEFGCTKMAAMRISVTVADANGQPLATTSRTAGCAPTNW